MKISTGTRMASATTEKTRSIPSAGIPAMGVLAGTPTGNEVAIAVTRTVPGVPASCAGECPMTITRESGDGSAVSPIVPTRWPG
jgi:hypothetical protein